MINSKKNYEIITRFTYIISTKIYSYIRLLVFMTIILTIQQYNNCKNLSDKEATIYIFKYHILFYLINTFHHNYI